MSLSAVREETEPFVSNWLCALGSLRCFEINMLYTSQHYMHKHKGTAISSSLRTELSVQQCFSVPKHTANPACCSRMPDYIRDTSKKWTCAWR